jgi:polyphosphate kinase
MPTFDPAVPPPRVAATLPSNGHPSSPARSGAAVDAHQLRPDVARNLPLLNRDLSWLEFNRRVLSLAQDERTPLLERVRFLAIFSSNLDEFVMKRLGLLQRRIAAGKTGPDLDGLDPSQLLSAMISTIRELQHQQAECFEHSVKPSLTRAGVELLEYTALSIEDKRWLQRWFRRAAFPVLTPLAVDPGHRFPFISNLSQNLGVLLRDASSAVDAEPVFARVKVPSVIPQWVRLPADPSDPAALASAGTGRPLPLTTGRIVSITDVILANLEDLFPGMHLVEVMPFRVTRDSESASEVDDNDADNLLELVEQQLRKRRFATPVRIESGVAASPQILWHLSEELNLPANDVDQRSGPLDFTVLTDLADADRPELRWNTWQAVTPPRLASKDRSIFEVIREGDLLVHHPFESFEASATRFITEASRDPDVLAIKQTIYRTSKDSPFVASLIRAAEAGKQVAVLVELRARFDEQSNVRWARLLEKAGAHVAYGVVGYKTHCKAALVVRRETDGLRSYCHLGTGNYHPRTAQLYTDLGLFTCDAGVNDDVIELFNFLTGRSRMDTYETLLVAPLNMKRRILDMIQREIGVAQAYAEGRSPVNGRIVAKMNALADSDVTERLYAASRAGVQITLFVRGFCCLRPGVPGLSENIRVISVLGRFLEHSRIFHFGKGAPDPVDGDWYISSADWMYRNLNNRVEAATPVLSRDARTRLIRILQIMAADRRGAWQLQPDGSYARLAPSPAELADPAHPANLGTFEALMRESRPHAPPANSGPR